MTPAEREALPPLDINEDDVKNALFTTGAWPVLACRERQLLAKMDLISTLELTLSNATRVGVVQIERIASLEKALRDYKESHEFNYCCRNGGDPCELCSMADDVLAPPPEPIPEEKK